MHASKETAQHALGVLLGQKDLMNEAAYESIKQFIETAKSKLPSEATYVRDKELRRERNKRARGFNAANTPKTAEPVGVSQGELAS